VDRDELIARLSELDGEWRRIVAEHRADEPDWEPLHRALPLEWCDGFMFMGYWGDIRLYKHGFTRYYLNLDADGNAYRYTGSCYVPTSLDAAIEHVFDGLEEMGETRSSVWDHRALRRRYEALSRAGWTVVGLGGAEDGAPD
jgi:hypothetical protein